MSKAGKEIIRPYGDRRDDGVVQLSFTLPVPQGERAKEAAALFVKKMGFSDVKVAAAEAAGEHYSFFVIYAKSGMYLDYAEVVAPEVVVHKLGFDELNQRIHEKLGRRIVVFGACTGSDSHTVGIDAILNMKGYAGDYGLERYPGFDAHNLGAQVPNEELVRIAREGNADAVLLSQVVTQREVHRENALAFIEVARREGLAGKALLLLGGPRISHRLALELGFDAGFGAGTRPSDVANYIVHALFAKLGIQPAPEGGKP